MANTFSLILVIVTLVTGVVWLLEKLVFAKKRQAKVAEIEAQTANGLDAVTLQKVERQPWWVENSVSIFPVIAFVLVLRSFIYEPFQIPSVEFRQELVMRSVKSPQMALNPQTNFTSFTFNIECQRCL